ncbi:hypothetical protein HMI54_002050 [Coelomomyces lativittatus]|nr:hypothetical protein HMI54_002050 [Coelomomyces lativittatus]
MLYFNDLVHHVLEFIEVAIHTILFVRQAYPKHVFKKTTKYDTPVMLCRSPIVIEYIQQALTSVRRLVQNACLERFSLLILDTSNEEVELERFAFRFNWILQLASEMEGNLNSTKA